MSLGLLTLNCSSWLMQLLSSPRSLFPWCGHGTLSCHSISVFSSNFEKNEPDELHSPAEPCVQNAPKSPWPLQLMLGGKFPLGLFLLPTSWTLLSPDTLHVFLLEFLFASPPLSLHPWLPMGNVSVFPFIKHCIEDVSLYWLVMSALPRTRDFSTKTPIKDHSYVFLYKISHLYKR